MTAPLLDPPLLVPPRDLAAALAARGTAPALLDGDTTVTYRDLAGRVRDVAERLGPVRRLVLLPAANDVDSVVALLGALHGRHPVLLTTAGADTRGLVEAYDPDVVAGPHGALQVRREGSAHALHPDLALLLSTSGSTGSPKLVRLSHRNLWSNAAAIASYLRIRPEDRATTSLPLGYCYGLSVLTSHLSQGAAVVLTGLSVADPCFWDLFRRTRATTFAAVPYTFDLLDRVGFDGLDLPSLRYVTQAGGRLAPERVRAYAELGRRRGWDLFVMYGQTEATARMAWLPPDLVLDRPEAVGLAVPGSSLVVEDPGPDGVGEIVFRGPGVMMGYATCPADLALPPGPEVLRTGDLGRQGSDGLVEVVGRRRPVAKVFGLRVDLGRVEDALAEQGLSGRCLELDGRLAVVVEGTAAPADVRRAAAAACGLPPRAVRARCVEALPRGANGKVDAAAVRELAAAPPPAEPVTRPLRGGPVHRLYAEVLDRADVGDDDTFVRLGGDSLSYVEASVRLEELLGEAPAGWHLLPVSALDALLDRAAPPPRRGRPLETTVLLRAVSILLVVGSHAGLWTVLGGAHVLLAVAGWNAARFPLTAPRAELPRRLLRSAARVWVPTAAWVTGVLAVGGAGYGLASLLPATAALGPPRLGPAWRLWFLEALVALLVALAVLLRVPVVDRLRRRAPFGVALTALGGTLLLRPDLLGPALHPSLVHVATSSVAWLFVLGWAGAEARTTLQRLTVSAVALLAVPGWFTSAPREAVVVAGLLALLWLPRVRVPAPVARAAGLLASTSLYVYVTHWQVFPHLEPVSPALAVVASFVVGALYLRVCQLLARWLTSMRVDASGTPAVPWPSASSALTRRRMRSSDRRTNTTCM